MQEDVHVFQGLRRDNHPIRQKGEFLWDAHNIRLTNRDDNTLLSITNEKGTKDMNLTYAGEYVGHCVIGKYLVVFTSEKTIVGNNPEFTTRIYRTEFTKENNYGYTLLVENTTLELKPDHPIQTLGSIETDLIQKVYWVDDEHQPRVINITLPELKGEGVKNNYEAGVGNKSYKGVQFDFVCNLELEEVVNVEKIYGTGIMSPGTIQYAFTYYNKYGQESNIFYTTPLYYISYTDRAGNGEERIANSFRITISGIDKNFDFIRVYSIHRTSIDGDPYVKQLNDIDITSLKNIEDKDKRVVSFIDTGAEGSTVDEDLLLYIGGRDVIAGCIAEKDNTLFLGNITLKDNEKGFKDAINLYKDNNKKTSFEIKQDNRVIQERDDDNSIYSYYKNDWYLDNPQCAGFKTNEKYRIGIQGQLSNGMWTSPVYIGDKVLTTKYPAKAFNEEKNKYVIQQYGSSIIVPAGLITQFNINKVKVKKLRACVVFPQTWERDVICQGILNPTVYNAKHRSNNAPFAQASWFFRPALPFTPEEKRDDDRNLGDNIQYKHNLAIYDEVQSSTLKQGSAINGSSKDTSDSDYYIDSNIVTFNSPDIEFDTNLWNLDYTNTQLRIVGYAELDSIYGDIDLTTSSPVAAKNASGFIHRIKGYNNTLPNDSFSLRTNGGLVSPYCYSDGYFNEPKNDDPPKLIKQNNSNDKISIYQVFAWHRNGSLNNDIVRGADQGTRTSVLSKKTISNLKVFNTFKPIEMDNNNIMDIDTPQIFTEDQVAIKKLNIDYLSQNSLQGVYQGNVDTLVTPSSEYAISTKSPVYKEGSTTEIIVANKSKEPVRIRYKSTPHMVFKFKGNSDTQTLLPQHTKVPFISDGILYPTWLVTDIDSKEYSDEELLNKLPDYRGELTAFGLILDYNDQTGHKNTLNDSMGVWAGYKTFARYTNSSNITYEGSGQIVIEQNTNPGGIAEYIYTFVTSNNVYGVYKITQGCVLRTSKEMGITTDTFDKCGIKYDKLDGEYYNPVYKDNYYICKEDCLIRIDKNTEFTKYTLRTDTLSRSGDYFIDIKYNKSKFGDSNDNIKPYLLIAELIKIHKDKDGNIIDNDTKFGGDSSNALQANMWLPASDPISIDIDNPETKQIDIIYGDTWYARYDCLKTYPFTKEDPNQIVEIGSFMCETRVNLNGRWDRNKGQLSNLNASKENFNQMNEAYSQKNNFFDYRIYDDDFYKNQAFNYQLSITKEKQPAADIDAWTNITVANTLDLDSDKGAITAIKVFNENVIAFQEKAINHILFNSRVQVQASDGVPIEISNGGKLGGYRALSNHIGCRNPWSIVNSPRGLYFIDSHINDTYLYNGELSNLSGTNGMTWWTRQPSIIDTWNPKNKKGVRGFYDAKYQDVYFTPMDSDALCFSEQLGQYSSFYSYDGTPAMFNFNDAFLSLRVEKDENNKPITKLYQNNAGEYNKFFGTFKPWDLSFISNSNSALTKIFDTIEFRADIIKDGKAEGDTYSMTQQDGQPFDFIQVDNEYQDTGNVNFDAVNLRKKFRIWRALIPRQYDAKEKIRTRNRIRNPWTKVTLGRKQDNTDLTVLHDLTVKYTI